MDHQAVLTGAVINLKRLAGWLRRRSAAVLAKRAPICESIPLAERLSALLGPTLKAVIPLATGPPTALAVLV